MSNFELIVNFSLLPIIDIQSSKEPKDGFSMKLSTDCRINLHKGNYCKKHYDNLKKAKPNTFFQCPFGFSSFTFHCEDSTLAITGFIPFPRFQTAEESKMAKKNPDNKISRQAVIDATSKLNNIYGLFKKIEKDTIENSSKALHEIRKLNQSVKHTSERLSKDDPMNKRLLTIFKASEMMSQQFNIIELLANETLSELELNAESNIFDLLYKCNHINSLYKDRIDLICESSYRPRAKVCDKTILILPNVLVTNAIKYSKDHSRVQVFLIEEDDCCIVKVINETKERLDMDESVYEKGVRFHKDSEGTGKGLYLAMLVAVQHDTMISHKTWQDGKKNMIEFSFKLKTIN